MNISTNNYYLLQNGKPFFWLADTWWYGMTSRMRLPIFRKLAKLRAKQGFNVIQIVIGIPPETNDYGMPLNEAYFDEVEKRLNILWDNNLIPCVVGGWGHHIDVLGETKIKQIWGRILQLIKNKPAVLCLCGEADIFPTKTRFFKKLLLKNRLKKWGRIASYIKENDREHLLTVHIQSRISARKLFKNASWLDINSIQSGHSKDMAGFMRSILEEESKEKLPIINLEPWYEGILGNFDEYYQRIAFWFCILSGANGHSYGAHGVWQMADGDNFMRHWGNSDWKTSIQFTGAKQLGLARKFIERYDWWKLKPELNIDTKLWKNDALNRPIAAKIGSEQMFIYFPDFRNADNSLITFPNILKAVWVNPVNLQIIKISKTTNIQIPKNYKNKDILCVLSFDR